MTDAALTLPAICPNCAAAVHGPYCAQCGQETVIGVPTLREFSHEYVQNFVAIEGRLWRTLWLLVRKPGQLTVEFLAGRRRRYVRPLPLYVSVSFVLFLLFTLFSVKVVQLDSAPGTVGATPGQNPGGLLRIRPDPLPSAQEIGQDLDNDVQDAPTWLRPMLMHYRASFLRYRADPQKTLDKVSKEFLAKLPYAVFLLVPLFAIGTRLLYRKRQRVYAEHFLFALHLHVFVFLTLIASFAFASRAVAPVLFSGWWVYLSLALRNVFGGRVFPQILKALALLLGHVVVVVSVMLIVLVLLIPFV